MAYDVTGQPFNRGKTLYGGQTPPTTVDKADKAILGHCYEFPDKDYSGTGAGSKSLRSGNKVTVQAVKNVSGIALLPGRVVKYKAGTNETQVDGYTTTTNERGAGVVDEWLKAAGVADDDVFYIVKQGPTLIKNALSAEADISVGSWLAALTAATSQAVTAGRPVAVDMNSTDVNALAVVNRFGHALSAVSSSSTGANVLADVNFLN